MVGPGNFLITTNVRITMYLSISHGPSMYTLSMTETLGKCFIVSGGWGKGEKESNRGEEREREGTI